VVRQLTIIGEAAKRLSPEMRVKCPGVDWREIARTRDKLVHHYTEIDLEEVWIMATEDVPHLLQEIAPLLSAPPKEDK
jgi:uncharacterized protein with HEPN domain